MWIWNEIQQRVNALSKSDQFKYILILTIIQEAIMVLFRFGFGLESTQDTSFIRSFTFDLRIHHSYIGIMILFTYPKWKMNYNRNLVLIISFSLVISDIIHHFVVLWIFTGSPQFDLFYIT